MYKKCKLGQPFTSCATKSFVTFRHPRIALKHFWGTLLLRDLAGPKDSTIKVVILSTFWVNETAVDRTDSHCKIYGWCRQEHVITAFLPSLFRLQQNRYLYMYMRTLLACTF